MTSTLRDMPGITGLRGIAVALVVAYHLGHLRGGFIGVDVFFVLSGFLITSLLLHRTPDTGSQMLRWWGRRIRRLTPAVAVVVVVVAVTFATTSGIALDGLATLTWWQNWRLVIEGTSYWAADASPLRHAWSLSIEEQFYLAWPPIVALVALAARRRGRDCHRALGALAVVGALASFGWAATLAGSGEVDLSRLYYGTDTRAGALLIGCAFAAFSSSRTSRRASGPLTSVALVAAGALVVMSVTLSPEQTWTYRGGLVLAALAALAVVAAAARPGPVSSALSAAPLRWVGTRSYAIYLWSWPTQRFLEERAPGLDRVWVALVTVLASLVLSSVSLRFVESPLRHADSWARRSAPRRTAWGIGSIVVLASLLFAASSAQPSAVEQVAREFERLPDPTTTSSVPCQPATPGAGPEWGDDTAAYDPRTVEQGTDPSGAGCDEAIRLLVVGDSTGRGAANGLRRAGPTDVEIWDRTELGCGLVPAGPECDDWRVTWPAAIEEIDPDVVLVYLGVSGDLIDGDDPPFLSEEASTLRREQVGAAIDTLSAGGAEVVWALPPQPLPVSEAAFFCGGSLTDSPCDEAWVERWHRDVGEYAAGRDVTTLDVRRWVEERGAASADRPDGLHLSGPALDAHATWLLDQVRAAVG